MIIDNGSRLKNVVVYPISAGKLINIGAFHAKEELAGTPFPGPWVTNVDNAELLAAHADWEPELQAILKVGTDRKAKTPFLLTLF
jgi:hypothetical protein